MEDYAVYNVETGEILRIVSSPNYQLAQLQIVEEGLDLVLLEEPLADESMHLVVDGRVEGLANFGNQFIKDGKATERPYQQTKLNGLTLTDLPVPCTIYINDKSYECDSDTVELEFDQPTTYEIRVESWPYQDWRTTYENHT